MNIVVLEGSPNKNGSSNLLAEQFIRGAKEAVHSVQAVDVVHANIHPCTGCIHCGYEGPCVQKDDVNEIRHKILDADMMVFVTPLYYYGHEHGQRLGLYDYRPCNQDYKPRRPENCIRDEKVFTVSRLCHGVFSNNGADCEYCNMIRESLSQSCAWID